MIDVAAQPFPFRFAPSRSALVMIDMQRDFIERGGFGEALGNDITPLAKAVAPAAQLVEACRAVGITIIHTKEAHRADLSDCPPSKRDRGNPRLRIGYAGPMGRILIDGEPGSDFVPLLRPRVGEHVVVKPGKGAFYRTGLDGFLRSRDVTSLIFGGVTTEVCVQTTMREANDRGYECLLIEEATASYFPQFKAATLDMIRAQGAIVGWTAKLDALLAALRVHSARLSVIR